jgi:hypothetical protein
MSDSSSPGLSQPSQYRPIGIILAVGSGVLIGSSFVLKKKGLLRSQAGHEAGEGVAYLKSVSPFVLVVFGRHEVDEGAVGYVVVGDDKYVEITASLSIRAM